MTPGLDDRKLIIPVKSVADFWWRITFYGCVRTVSHIVPKLLDSNISVNTRKIWLTSISNIYRALKSDLLPTPKILCSGISFHTQLFSDIFILKISSIRVATKKSGILIINLAEYSNPLKHCLVTEVHFSDSFHVYIHMWYII